MFAQKKIVSSLLVVVCLTGFAPTLVYAFDQPWDSGHNTTQTPPPKPPKPPKDPCEDGTGSPVYLRTGNLVLGFTDLSFPGGPIPFEVHRQYNNQEKYNGPFGHGWVTTNIYQLTKVVKNNAVEQVIIRKELGQRYTFARNPDGSFTPLNENSYDVLRDNGDGTFTLNPSCGGCGRFGLEYNFNETGYLSSIKDSNGNTISFAYDGTNRLVRATDSLGRYFSYAYGPNNKITSITDSAGRTVRYAYDANNNLTAVTNPLLNTVSYSYDSDHNLLTVVDPKGNVAIEVTYDSEDRVKTYSVYGDRVTYTYDSANLKTTKTDSLGNATTYTYNPLGVVTRIDYSDGSYETFAYDEKLNLVSYTDGRGFTTSYTYDHNGNRISVTDALGRTTLYTYEPNFNRILTETDPRGVVTQYEYDSRGNLLKKYRAYGTPEQIVETFTYDASGRKLTYTDPDGNTTTYGYNSAGYLTTVTDPYGNVVETNTYDERGNRITKKDVFNNVTTYQYDALNRLVAIVDAKGYVYSRTYDENGNLATETDGNGNTTAYEYNFFNQLIKVRDPMGNVKEMGYTERGNLKWIKDPLGNLTYFQYNARGRMTKKIIKVGDTSETPDADDIVTTYAYDFSGNRIQETNPNGKTTTFVYDGLNRIVEKTLPTGESITFTYDEVGNLVNQTAGTGLALYYEYDRLNRVKKIEDSMGVIATYTYNGLGKPLTKTDANGHTTSFQYDKRGNLIKRTYPDGSFDTMLYDAGGRLTQVTDRGGSSVTFAYDELNRIVSSTDNMGNTTTATYDAFRKLTLTDANGNTTTYEYNANDQLTKETYADSTSVVYTYDANGRLASKTDAKGTTIRFEYNERGLLTKRDYPGTNDDIFTYGRNSELLSAVNGDATVTRTYDDSGRFLSESINGKTVQYSYDTTNQRRTITYPGGKVVKEVFDVRERVTNITDVHDTDLLVYQYNLLNKPISLTYANGTLTQYTYNVLNLLSGITHVVGGSPFIQHEMTRENSGKVTSVSDQLRPSDSELYHYDDIQRLVGFKRGALSGGDIPSPTREIVYNLDAMSNWTTLTIDDVSEERTTNSLNQYLTRGTTSLSYDANGNLTDDGTYLYSYDAMNRLVQVRLKSNGAEVANYKYDALGRMISKTASGTITTYHYDFRFRMIEEQEAGVTSATYIFGVNQDEILQMERGGQTYYYHSDFRGNVVAITNGMGAVVEQYKYDPYGTPFIFDAGGTPRTSSAIGNTFLYKGKKYDFGTGLYFFRARFYSPLLGRFITRDPAGYSDGLNLYEYAHSDPIGFDDPFGLAAEECGPSGGFEFDLGKLAKITKVIKTFGADFNVGGGVSVKTSTCQAKCCKKQITYRKWELEANLKMTYEGVVPNLGISVPGVGKFGVIGAVEFGIRGSGQFSETFDKDCNVVCANRVCVGVYGQVSLMAGAKLAEAGDDELVKDPWGGEIGIKGTMGASGDVCYGCNGWEFRACISGKIELVASIKFFWVSVGGSFQIFGGEICTSNLQPE
jgi:RHS repeat-associated protein